MKPANSKRRWLTTGVITLLIIIGPTACIFFENCPDTELYFSIQGLDIYNVTYTGEPRRWRSVESNESIKYDSFLLRIGFKSNYYSEISSGGQNLFALSCNENGYAGSTIGVDTLYVVSLQDYNSHYFMNDTLNNIVLMNYSTSYYDDYAKFFSMENYLDENKDNIRQQYFEIRITEPPSAENEFTFKVIYVLKNGDSFEETNDKVRLTL